MKLRANVDADRVEILLTLSDAILSYDVVVVSLGTSNATNGDEGEGCLLYTLTLPTIYSV